MNIFCWGLLVPWLVTFHLFSAKKKFPARGAPRSRLLAILEMSPRALCQMSNVRDWCRRGMSWNEKPKDLYWNWPVLYKQQIIVALISKQPTIPMFSFFLLIVFDQSQMFAIQKAKSIGNLEETCSLEIPCWQSSAVAKPTEHNDEDQSWDKILQFSKAWLSVALVFSCTNSSSI